MYCRIIITAIAISCTFSREITVHDRDQGSQRLVQIKDVICVLLLSGMQKEDLDANTLAKLRRHNVNIYNMNNESLREECLTKSYLDPGKSVTNDMNEDSIKPQVSANKQTFSDNAYVNRHNPEIIVDVIHPTDKINLQHLINEINKDVTQIKQISNDNVDIRDVKKHWSSNDDISIVKEHNNQQMEYFKDQPSLVNVMKFWTSFMTKDRTTISTENPAVYSFPPTEKKIEITPTKVEEGNIQFKEKEYINRIIAEFLGNQTIATTTPASKSRVNMDIVSRKLKELLDRTTETDPTVISKNPENAFEKKLKELTALTEFSKLFQTNEAEEKTEKALYTPDRMIYDYHKDVIKRPEVAVYSSLTDVRTIDTKSVNMKALEYLNNMLHGNNKFKLDGAVHYGEVNTEAYTDNEKQEMFKKHKVLQEYSTESPSKNHKISNIIEDTNLAKDEVGTVSVDVIKEIAEKVKEIVMKDLRKDIPSSKGATSRLTTTTSATTIANPTTSLKEANESSVMQSLVELLKEFKTMREVTLGTTALPVGGILNKIKSTANNITSYPTYPIVNNNFNPNVAQTSFSKIKEFNGSTNNLNLGPVPSEIILHPNLDGPKYIQQINIHQKRKYQVPPRTIQTNFDEIPPLIIELSEPMKVMNQNIIVTTQNPFIKKREEKLHQDNDNRLSFIHSDPLHMVDERNHPVGDPKYIDLTEKLRAAENIKKEFRESYKDKMEKIKERVENNRSKASEFNHFSNLDQSMGVIGLAKATQHDSSNLDLNRYGSQIHRSSYRDPSSRQFDSNHHETFNRPLDSNQPLSSNYRENINRLDDPNYRDFIARDILSRLMNSKHLLSQLVDTGASLDMRRPTELDYHSRSHQSEPYDRFEHQLSQSRYKPTRFHEKLEQIENRPINYYEGNSKVGNENSGPVGSRQLMSLTNIKERQRFDDSHFRNFIKSQQKVTDMLESILAAKSKTKNGGEKQ